MTAFTLLHTIVSVLPVGFGLAAYARHGSIDPKTRLGKWYVGTMLAGTISGFGFILTSGFTPGQTLGLFTLALLAVGTLSPRGTSRQAGYTPAIALSASYLLLWVFLTTETLKRFPTGRPAGRVRPGRPVADPGSPRPVRAVRGRGHVPGAQAPGGEPPRGPIRAAGGRLPPRGVTFGFPRAATLPARSCLTPHVAEDQLCPANSRAGSG